MKEINKSVLVDAAHRLLFDMTDEQYELLLKEFAILIKQMELIGKIKGLDETNPMTFPFDVSVDTMREDIPLVPVSATEAVKNAQFTQDGQIKVPKVVG
jgi:aspartyl/glutamyl-tRNA(Asn/Gln) amidotransferase C subunit